MEGPKNLRFYIWFVKAFAKKHFRIISIGLISGFLLSSLLSTFQISVPKISKKRMVAIVGSYNPSNLPKFIQNKLSRGLTKINEDGSVDLDLAEEYKIEENGKKYVFKIKKGLKFSDGTPFNSFDINYNFKDVEIQRPDENTVIYILKESFAPFPVLTSQPIFKAGLVGIGEYKLVNLKMGGNRIEFIKIVNLETNNEEIYKFYPSESAAIIAFKLGEVNAIYEIKDPQKVKNLSKVKIYDKVNENNFVAVFFSLKNQTVSEKSFRQALAYAVKEEVKNGYKSLSPYNPNSWVYNNKVKKYEYDINNAKKLLNANKNATQSAEIKLTLSAIDIYQETAEKLKDNWKELGIETEIQIYKSIPENFQLLLAASEIPIDPDQYSIWHSTQKTNITGYQSPKIDKLLEEGRRETDREKRKQIYLDLQKALLEDLPAIFLYYPKIYSVER